jgi:mono/diheme cytochrome c family protein
MKGLLNLFLPLSLTLLMTSLAATGAEIRGDLSLGKEVYEELCASCHGTKGDGKGPGAKESMPRPQVFTDSSYMRRLTPQYLFDVAKYGKLAVLKGEKKTGNYPILPMPGFEDSLEDDEIRALAAYVKFLLTGRWDPSMGSASIRKQTKEYFEGTCAVCHGRAGKGDGVLVVGSQDPKKPYVSVAQPAPVDLTDPVQMARFSDEFIFWLLKNGRIGNSEVKNFDTMKSFGQILSDKEIWSTVRYLWETFIEKKEKP